MLHESNWRKRPCWALYGVCVLIGLASAGEPKQCFGQRLDAPQARLIYTGDGYTVQAISLGRGHALVTNSEHGLIKTMLVVQPYDLFQSDTADRNGGMGRRVTRPSLRQELVGGVVANGSSQRIIGVECDDSNIYVLVAGLSLEASGVDAASTEVAARGWSQTDLTEGTQSARVMLHVYDHRTTLRVISWELASNQTEALSPPSLNSGPMELVEEKLSCLGWELDFSDKEYIHVTSPEGDLLHLPTEETSVRMRSM